MRNKLLLSILLPFALLTCSCHETVYVDYCLVYYSQEGGEVLDYANTIQIVYQGHDGVLVTATPKNGYIFTCWSDGLETPERQDKNVHHNIYVTACFEKEGA